MRFQKYVCRHLNRLKENQFLIQAMRCMIELKWITVATKPGRNYQLFLNQFHVNETVDL